MRQKKNPALFFNFFLLSCTLVCLLPEAAPVHAANQKIQPVVITSETSIKKTGSFDKSLSVFIVPVLAVGSGKCKATLSVAEPLDTEIISLVCWGVCCGPYAVFDYKTAASQYAVSTTVTVETWGVFFVVATIAGPAENFPKKASVAVQF